MSSSDEDEYVVPPNTNTEDDFPKEWLPRGAHVGEELSRNLWTEAGIVATKGRIVARVSPRGRRPALYLWESQPSVLTGEKTIQIISQDEINANAAGTIVSPSDYQNHMLSQVNEHLAANLETYTVANVLPDCFLHAILEEAWFHFLQRESAALLNGTTTASSAATPTIASRASYYSSTHVTPPTNPNEDDSASNHLYFTVSSLHQRIKAGTQLAHQYQYAYSTYAASLKADNFNTLRRSRRIPKPERPNPYQKGGKVASYLLERCMKKDEEEIAAEKKKAEKEEKEASSSEEDEKEDSKEEESPPVSLDKKIDKKVIPPAAEEKVVEESSSKPEADKVVAESSSKPAVAEKVEGGSKKGESKESAGEAEADKEVKEEAGDKDAKEDIDKGESNEEEVDAKPSKKGKKDDAVAVEEKEEKEEVILIDAHEEELESEEGEADKDDDFDTNDEMEDEEDDDDELEGVVQQRDQLDIEMDGLHQEDGEEEEEEEEDDDLDGDYVSENPFLQPTPESVLDWLGRRGKSMGIPELQEAIGVCMKQNLGLYDLSSMDQLAILGKSGTQGDTFLLEGMEKWKELKKYDPTTFAKCKFRLKSDKEEELQWFRQQELEDIHRKEKAWASWRFKGIHGGYTVWSSWTESVDEWIKDKKGEAPPPPEVVTPVENASGGGETDDLALAQSLAADAATASRRSARRANTTNDAVFYGSQTQMSQKQLMETLVRLCRQSTYHTLLGLQTLVGEDSTNPVHRLRIAVGRLVYKRNQLIRQRVTSVWSDQPLWISLKAAPLWTIEDDESLNEDTKACANAVVQYVRQLHQTELQLRNMVLRQLTNISTSAIATAADERVGTLESFDSSDFEVPENIEWATTGHDYLGKAIFRPAQQPATDHMECSWYKIKDYVDSVPYDGPMDEKGENGATLAERRMRFRAVPRDSHQGGALILTEGQVAAGLKAATQATDGSKNASSQHPFAGGVGTPVTLKAATSTMQCVVVGYDTVAVEAEGTLYASTRQHKTLLLPEARGVGEKEAFWTKMWSDDDGNIACRMIDAIEPITYKIEQSDYELESAAFRACQGVVNFLYNHKHAGIFLEPVDPVALNIPTYFDVVKRPMDITTLSENLEKGLYSKIPPTKSVGRSAVSRMLNGPFKDDALLIFDNAIRFNPPDDWIHQTAKSIRKSVIKKIEQAMNEAETGSSNGRRGGYKSSVYVDEDSDVDMYEYESDNDEDFTSGKRKKRKRKSGGNKEDVSTKAMEAPLRLQSTLSETLGLRGPFAKLPVVSDARSFSLGPEWGCRHKVKKRSENQKAKDDQAMKELKEILELQRLAEESDRASLRRSARAQLPDDFQEKSNSSNALAGRVAYSLLKALPGIPGTLAAPEMTAASRAEIESLLEQAHEKYYAKLHQQMHKHLGSNSRNGLFANASFPPYLGRVRPSCLDGVEPTWEIRSEYVVPAVRWVIRGLLQSGHLTELEPLTVESPFTSGVIMTSDIYFHDPANNGFHLLEIRRKKKEGGANDESSEDEIELSEYEKLRAERVARNADRLKILGLA
jgi:hypothetical protein